MTLPRLLSSILVPALLLGCHPAAPTRPDPTAEAVPGVAVDQLPLVEIALPGDCRDGSAPPPTVPLTGWSRDEAVAGTVWRHAAPIRPRSLFFLGPPRSIQVLDETGRQVPYATRGGRRTWSLDQRGLAMQAGRPDEPAPVGWAVQSEVARVREARLNLDHSGLDPDAFARASLRVGHTTRRGLYLPAPATAAVELRVPPAAELHLTPGIVPPEVRDLAPGDGATLVVEVQVGTKTTTVHRSTLTEGVFQPLRLDLSPWSGKQVRLRLRTEPGADSRYDYVLVADPIIAPRRATAKRVVLAFVDTLRPDRLGVYGYERPTSPTLDAWATRAVVFDQARSVAPWTLPAYRSLVTGRLPTDWRASRTLPGLLRDRGWATAMFGGNVYLSSNFEGDRGWGSHHVVNAPSATEQVDRALEWLAAQPDRDALLLVHFMDPHLPYSEPDTHRSLFAGAPPDGLPDKLVRRTVKRHQDEDGVRAYVSNRYDNNVRYVDDELARLLGVLGPDDLVIVFSDHGEEFWEHDGFEHGHTLNEELVRVPLLVRGPGFVAGRRTAPVSLLDVTPTVLAWAGEAPVDGPGKDLATVGVGAAGGRPIPLGHPLYGVERWGVVQSGRKYRSSGGDEHLHDLGADPGEHADLWESGLGPDVGTWRSRMAAAHGAELGVGWRIVVSSLQARRAMDGMEVRVSVPGGVAQAWVGADPNGSGRVTARIEDGVAIATWPEEWRGKREVYVLPARPIAETTPEFRIRRGDDAWLTMTPPPERPTPDGGDALLVQEWPDEVRLRITHAAVPIPTPGGTETVGYSPELEGVLRATGYAVGPDRP